MAREVGGETFQDDHFYQESLVDRSQLYRMPHRE